MLTHPGNPSPWEWKYTVNLSLTERDASENKQMNKGWRWAGGQAEKGWEKQSILKTLFCAV